MQALEEGVAAPPEPRDYFRGQGPAFSALPRNVLCFRRDRPIRSSDARHHRFVLVSCIHGPGAAIIDGRLLPLPERHGLLIFPQQGHHFAGFRQQRICWLFTTFELDEPAALNALRDAPTPLGAPALTRLGAMLRHFRAETAGSAGKEELVAELYLLLAELRRAGAGQTRGGGESQEKNPHAALIAAVAAYVHGHIEHRLRIADIAAHVGLSDSRLRTLFRSFAGLPLGAFVRQVKINRACSLLHDSELNISQIAEACGFSSIYAFSRSFAAERGCAPSAYRRAEQGGQS